MTPVIALLANKLPPRLREATALEALGAAVSARGDVARFAIAATVTNDWSRVQAALFLHARAHALLT
jgi:hypothetical protein